MKPNITTVQLPPSLDKHRHNLNPNLGIASLKDLIVRDIPTNLTPIGCLLEGQSTTLTIDNTLTIKLGAELHHTKDAGQ